MISIQNVTNREAEIIADLSRQTFYETFAAFNSKNDMDKFMNEQFTKEQLIQEVQDSANIFFVALDENKPVGYLFLRESSNPEGLENLNSIEIARIYSVNSSIGTGVGKLLMEKCLETAKKNNKKIIWLGVWEKNTRAINFYKKWGFEKFGEHSFLLGDDVQKDWLMKKSLE